MLDLYEELGRLVEALDRHRIEYALCGGLAMAAWGFPRATIDIDIVIQPESLDATVAVAGSLGYTLRARPMTFSSGAILIHRISQVDRDAGDVLMLDLMLATPAIADVWESRTRVEWERGTISVVSREGLIKLKSFRGSGRDADDIALLRDTE